MFFSHSGEVQMIAYIPEACIIFFLANAWSLNRQMGIPKIIWPALILLFLYLQIRPSPQRKIQKKRLRICKNGCLLLRAFLLSTAGSIVYSLLGYMGMLQAGSLFEDPKLWLMNTVIAICV